MYLFSAGLGLSLKVEQFLQNFRSNQQRSMSFPPCLPTHRKQGGGSIILEIIQIWAIPKNACSADFRSVENERGKHGSPMKNCFRPIGEQWRVIDTNQKTSNHAIVPSTWSSPASGTILISVLSRSLLTVRKYIFLLEISPDFQTIFAWGRWSLIREYTRPPCFRLVGNKRVERLRQPPKSRNSVKWSKTRGWKVWISPDRSERWERGKWRKRNVWISAGLAAKQPAAVRRPREISLFRSDISTKRKNERKIFDFSLFSVKIALFFSKTCRATYAARSQGLSDP